MESMGPFNRLVKLVARAFYDDLPENSENQNPNTRRNNRGILVVVLDALTRRQWVREDDLAKDLKLHTKEVRRILRFLEEEMMITRDHLNEIYDVVRYRLLRMEKKLKDELASLNTVQEYICPNCSKRYTVLDAATLISFTDAEFHCESCDGVLVAGIDEFAAQELGDRDDNVRSRRHEKLRDLLTNMEDQLGPLVVQLDRLKDLPFPEFGSLQDWELRANASGLSNGDIKNKGDVKSVEVDMPKVQPSWMINQGMNIAKVYFGDATPEEAKVRSVASNTTEISAYNKMTTNLNDDDDDNAKNKRDEYIKAYAMVQKEQETARTEPTNATTTFNEEDDIEWVEEAPFDSRI